MIGILGWVIPECHGTLRFELPILELSLPVDVHQASASFPFINAGESPIRILRIDTECDCSYAFASPDRLAFGQSGEVVLQFRARKRHGTETIRATVVTDGGGSHDISVITKLKSYIEADPESLVWKKDEAREPKEFTIRSTGLGKLRFTKATATSGAQADLISDGTHQMIRVQVTPPAGKKPFRGGVLLIAAVEETGETKMYDLHVRGE